MKKAQTRILRSQLEQRLGDRADPLINVDVERLGNVQWWSLVSQYTSDQSEKTMHCEEETRDCCEVCMWDITKDLVLRSFSRQTV